jgi:hypothetical protein
VRDAVNAAHLHMDPRPLLGLTEADRGSTVERVLMQTVLDLVVAEREEAIREQERQTH